MLLVLLLLRVAARGSVDLPLLLLDLLLQIMSLLLLLLLRRMLLTEIGTLTLLPAMLFPRVAAYRSVCGQCVLEPVFRSACNHHDVGTGSSLVAAPLGLIWRNDHNPPGC